MKVYGRSLEGPCSSCATSVREKEAARVVCRCALRAVG